MGLAFLPLRGAFRGAALLEIGVVEVVSFPVEEARGGVAGSLHPISGMVKQHALSNKLLPKPCNYVLF